MLYIVNRTLFLIQTQVNEIVKVCKTKEEAQDYVKSKRNDRHSFYFITEAEDFMA